MGQRWFWLFGAILCSFILLASLWAWLRPLPLPHPPSTPPPVPKPPAFGDFFERFYFGRPLEGNKIKRHTQLIRITRITAGRKFGIAAKTNPRIKRPFYFQVRVIDKKTQNEVRAWRKNFRARPGAYSYCCLVIKEPGKYELQVFVNGQLLSSFPLKVKPRTYRRTRFPD
jgi:hypothetical protein